MFVHLHPQCENVCLISKGFNEKSFSCDERKYRISSNNTIQIKDSVTTIRDIKNRINSDEFRFDLLNGNTKSVRFQDKLIYMSEKKHVTYWWTRNIINISCVL